MKEKIIHFKIIFGNTCQQSIRSSTKRTVLHLELIHVQDVLRLSGALALHCEHIWIPVLDSRCRTNRTAFITVHPHHEPDPGTVTPPDKRKHPEALMGRI